MILKCRAFFRENSPSQFGFYGLPGEAFRRIKNEQEFDYNYDEDKDIIKEVDGKNMIDSWIQVLEMPKKRKAKKSEAEPKLQVPAA